MENVKAKRTGAQTPSLEVSTPLKTLLFLSVHKPQKTAKIPAYHKN